MSAVIDRWITEDVDSSCAHDIGKLFGPVELCGKPSTLVLHESKAGSHDVYPICDSCAGELGLG
ncbi:MAG: hypothetical protein F4169_04610 [Gammaproteobacteria bacterium]|nr:hypothetical protein [Rhodothermaceae bacterium]MYF28136.1 hypothetical protein [Gammaproteobacteria bacterium]